MSETYVVGDVHGCIEQFDALLSKVDFRVDQDRLWLVGDIINRGAESLAMLRRAIELHQRLGQRFAMVLGNHEIHLIKVACGLSKARRKDTLDPILQSHDLGDLINWLRHRKLVHVDGEHVMVHAGFKPEWTTDDAITRARGAERRLQTGEVAAALRDLDGDDTLAILTKVRMFDERLRASTFNGSPEEATKDLTPWFDLWAERQIETDRDHTVVFGHWAALGHRRGGSGTRRWISLDSGCVYGRQLSALRLSDLQVFTIDR